MATACAGVSVTWGGAALQEVVDIKATAGGSLPIGRDSTFALDGGTIEIVCLHTANISLAERGLKKTLAFSGGGVDLSVKAVLQTLAVSGKVNDVARYTATYKLVFE
ncbi:MAG: hypothetical protein EB117_17585 [Betaproteobacteria bacterium]|nr:hypothetical protein [Betaproteobacteria bacterium]